MKLRLIFKENETDDNGRVNRHVWYTIIADVPQETVDKLQHGKLTMPDVVGAEWLFE